MRVEYVVVGAAVVLAIVAGIAILPDFIRYMKIRSM